MGGSRAGLRNQPRFSAPAGGGEGGRERSSPRGRCEEKGSLRPECPGPGAAWGRERPLCTAPRGRAPPSLLAPRAGARPSVPVLAELGQGLSRTLTNIPEGDQSPPPQAR